MSQRKQLTDLLLVLCWLPATPPAFPPAGQGVVESGGVCRVQLAAGLLEALGVQPDAQGVFHLALCFLVTGPVPASGAVGDQTGQTVLPPRLVGNGPGVFFPTRQGLQSSTERRGQVSGCRVTAAPLQPGSQLAFLGRRRSVRRVPAFPSYKFDELIHAVDAAGRDPGARAVRGKGFMFAGEARFDVPGGGEVVADFAGRCAHKPGNTGRCQATAVHQHPLRVRHLPRLVSHMGTSCHATHRQTGRLKHFWRRMGTMELAPEERVRAAAALEEILQQVEAGDVSATAGQLAYTSGTAAGLRARLDVTGQ